MPARKPCPDGPLPAGALRDRPEAHRGELEIFAAEKEGGGEEEDQRAEPREQQEWHRKEINQDREQRGLAALEHRTRERQRRAGRIGGIMAALDFKRDVIDEEARDQRRHRRHQEDRSGNDAEPGRE